MSCDKVPLSIKLNERICYFYEYLTLDRGTLFPERSCKCCPTTEEVVVPKPKIYT